MEGNFLSGQEKYYLIQAALCWTKLVFFKGTQQDFVRIWTSY